MSSLIDTDPKLVAVAASALELVSFDQSRTKRTIFVHAGKTYFTELIFDPHADAIEKWSIVLQKNLLTESDLQGAAFLCLAKAATTDRNAGGGDIIAHRHHERKHRFDEAFMRMGKGITNVTELGITAEDCAWAISNARYAKDPKEWTSHFQTTETQLKAHLERQK